MRESPQRVGSRRSIVRRGFSLLEMLAVLVIIGLLAAIVAPTIIGKLGSSRVKTTKAQMMMLENAIYQFQMDMGRIPTPEEGLNVLLERPTSTDAEKWNGPYLERDYVPVDGWGNAFEYDFDEHERFILRSTGADGKIGGTGDNADLNSRSL